MKKEYQKPEAEFIDLAAQEAIASVMPIDENLGGDNFPVQSGTEDKGDWE